MKLNLTYESLGGIVNGSVLQYAKGIIDVVVYDSRKISTTQPAAFFALQGVQKNGHTFCEDAYNKGVRCFVVEEKVSLPKDAHIILVDHVLMALQELAKHHRNQFSIPVIAITGSFGKTTIKEWLYYLLKEDYVVGRTPNSYNSQLGVALALLELEEKHELAIIEADISHPNEMERLEKMISPTLGIFSGLGNHYAENFSDQKAHLNEHLLLFKHVNFCFILEEYASPFRRQKINTIVTQINEWKNYISEHEQFPTNKALCLKVAEFFGIDLAVLKQKMEKLPTLSGRQEVFEGIQDNLIINDTYNIDIDALEQSLDYQFASKERMRKVVVLDLSFVAESRQEEIKKLVNRYQPDAVYYIENDQIPIELKNEEDALILFKGSFRSNLSQLVQQFKNRKHETWVEFDLRAIQYNLKHLQGLLMPNTKTLVMVKASSYGTGDVKIPHFLQENGVDYLGVAYTDEGATLRENGIHLPIMVMNTEENALGDVLVHLLEPSIYTLKQLKTVVRFFEARGIENYPIHIEVETGMNRLGFNSNHIETLVSYLSSVSAVRVKSVFSHLADADNEDPTYSQQQINSFLTMRKVFMAHYSSPILFHILNSEGISKFSKIASFDMVRMGIGIFGYAYGVQGLKESIRWKTSVSQVKTLLPGETVGYGRTFRAEKEMKIATLRIGYADGFRRSLSNGVGGVYIRNVFCPVVGNVCMDMTMVDVTGTNIASGDEVEIIGEHQTMRDFANQLNTIPYEVMTSINKRVARIYVKH